MKHDSEWLLKTVQELERFSTPYFITPYGRGRVYYQILVRHL